MNYIASLLVIMVVGAVAAMVATVLVQLGMPAGTVGPIAFFAILIGIQLTRRLQFIKQK
ncbi:hypothetical protein HY469_02565 [Candidatus Roizmanbacteria bacterium]|nr:hypothetical protein [Candidatus Roizmanbacteria bacterium]